jgi:hypothetical protein
VIQSVVLVEVGVGGFKRKRAALGHGVARVDDQVQNDLLDLADVGFDRTEFGAGLGDDFHVFADKPAQHLVQVHQNHIEIKDTRLQQLFAAKSE